ncbi:MAG: diguanylate cyclase [Alphaproteobacteria bacterium]|nr:diguanylate cyclase [Alphaproteobacteria bacterium]
MDKPFGAERRLRDFVEMAGDFAWEVDAAGRFVFVAPSQIHGWPAPSLLGRMVADFLVDPDDIKAFTATEPLVAEAIRLRDAGGSAVTVVVRVRPVTDAAGQWIGARGVARETIDPRAQQIELDEARLRDGLCRHVVRALRDEPQPEAALEAALTALGLTVDATGGSVLRRGADGAWRPAAHWGLKPSSSALALVRDALACGDGSALEHDGGQIAVQAVAYRRETKGAVLLWRRDERAAFTAGERSLLADVADQIGIALAQLDARERIDRLSRTDHLTGLANRGAFFDEFARRLSRVDRVRSAALLYVDVANLKVVNTLRGPEAGDIALAALAALLREHTRPGDLIARFGAGEFVLWIERIDVDGARARAAALRAAAVGLAERVGCGDLPFGISVGTALFDSTRAESIMQLVLRAAADAGRGNSGKEKGGELWSASLPA